MSGGLQIGAGRSTPGVSRKKPTFARAWAASVPALDAPPGLAPSVSFMRALHDRYPEVTIRYDRRPQRRCFVLWEKTRTGHWVVIKDVPRGMGIDRRIIDYLNLCDMAKSPSVQAIINKVDQRAAELKRKRVERSKRKHQVDWDHIMWAATKDAAEAESYPMGVFSQVPGSYNEPS